MAEQWKVGDEVQLKSGSPAMTVTGTGITGTDGVRCTWFEGNKKYEETFPAAALVRYDEEAEDMDNDEAGEL
jgi:uncharacterized protein YodC (DUF2158 family)